ncbi:MAG: tetratricopeptide repeat protein, partial [Myxococcota bacterium]|nr:tetratricopeptide repeat protein [Myxococcota bacterium]
LRAVALEPHSETAHDAALTLARASGGGVKRYIDGTGAVVDRAFEAGDIPLACALLLRLGGAAEHDLGDDPRAASLYERAVDLGFRTPEVLRALDRVFDRLRDAEKQARALSMLVEVETRAGGPRAATDATYRLAALRLAARETFDEGVDMMRAALAIDPQLDRAEAALRRAVAIDPTHRRVLDLYEHVGRQPGHERALVDALRARCELSDAGVNAVREAVGAAGQIGDRALAESLLARFIEREQATGENVASLAWALDALANLRRVAGDLAKAVELKSAAAAIADPEEARRLIFEVAHIAADEMVNWELAADTYEELRRSDPVDRAAWEPLLAVYRQQRETRKLAELLATVVDYVDEAGTRARLRLERISALQELGLSDADAVPLLREVVDEDASQVKAALMLAAILERTGAPGELTELLARQIDAAKDRNDSASIVSLSMRLGALLAPTDPMAARDVYYTGLEWDPKSVELLDALGRLLEGEGDVAERADVLERRLGAERGPGAEGKALELSGIRMHLGDETGATRALELGYRAYPASATLCGRLEAAFRSRDEWRKLAELCEIDARSRSQPAERVARLTEAAKIWRTELKDLNAAAAALRLALAESRSGGAEASDPPLLSSLVDLLVEAGDMATALSELDTEMDRLAADDPRRPSLLAARANVRLSSGNEAAALVDLEAAFAIDHGAYAAPLLVLLNAARTRAFEAGDASAVRLFRMRHAQVSPHAGDADGARATLVDLLKEDPKDRAALRGLADLESSLGRWDTASAALKRLIGLEDAEGTVDAALRLADACERAGRPGDARGALERARAVAPQERSVRRRLEGVYEQMGAWYELAELLLEDARANGDVADRFELLLRAGSVLLEQAGDPRRSIEALEEARTLRPLDSACISLLADAYTLSGRAQDALALLEPMIAPHKGRRARELAPLYYRLARIARYSGNATEEVRSLVLALECDAQNGEVCSAVALRAMESDQLELANRALRAITLLKKPGPVSKALAYQRMGEIARRQGDPKRALMLLNRALVEDPSLQGARALVESIERGA